MSSYVWLISPKLMSISCNEMAFCLAKAFYKCFLICLFLETFIHAYSMFSSNPSTFPPRLIPPLLFSPLLPSNFVCSF